MLTLLPVDIWEMSRMHAPVSDTIDWQFGKCTLPRVDFVFNNQPNMHGFAGRWVAWKSS